MRAVPFWKGWNGKRLAQALTQQSLTVKLAGAMCAVFCLVVGLGTLAVMDITKRAIAETSITSALYQTHLLRSRLLESMQDKGLNPEAIRTLLRESVDQQKAGKVNLFDSEGQVRFSSEPENAGRKILGVSGHGGRWIPDSSFTEFTSLDKAGSLRIVHPIHGAWSRSEAEGEFLGGIELFVPLEPIYKRFALNRVVYALAALALVALVTFLIRRLVHWIVKQPIRKLRQVMEKAESGELDVQARIYEDPDLRRLAKSFNFMVRGIRSARKRIEEQHQKELAQANRLVSLGQLLSNVSHEIRNPLASIRSTLHALRNDFKDAAGQEIFQEMNAQVLRIEQTVNHLLRYVRQAPPKFEDTSIFAPIHQALHLAEPYIQQRRIRVACDMRARKEEGIILCDAGQIQQVFLNLFLNAAQAMKNGGTLTIRAEFRDQRFLCVEVEDTGDGIAPEHLSKIFEPFFTTREGGTGLGLAVVKGIVEKHGGFIFAQSVPGRGTTMTLGFPAVNFNTEKRVPVEAVGAAWKGGLE